jgi:thioredoxin 1
MTDAAVAELDASSLRAALEDDRAPLLIDFWAPWCGSCRLQAPALGKLAGELEDGLRVGKVDVAAHPALAEEFGVQGLPTLVLIRGDEELLRLTGLHSLAALSEAVEPHLPQTGHENEEGA